jgi:hypothetical protein
MNRDLPFLPELTVTQPVYEQLHAMNDGFNRAVRSILEMAESPLLDRHLLQRSAFRQRELQSSLNAVLTSQLSEKEMEQANRIEQWLATPPAFL